MKKVILSKGVIEGFKKFSITSGNYLSHNFDLTREAKFLLPHVVDAVE